MTTYDKPLPPVDDPVQEPFWSAARDHRFLLQECDTCSARRWPPSPVCPECLTTGGTWTEVETAGTVWSFAIYDRAYRPEYEDDVPYNVALIELAAGPKMISNVVAADLEDIQMGQDVDVVFDDVAEGVTLVRFSPVSGKGALR